MSLVFSKEVKDSNGRSKYIYKSKLFVSRWWWNVRNDRCLLNYFNWMKNYAFKAFECYRCSWKVWLVFNCSTLENTSTVNVIVTTWITWDSFKPQNQTLFGAREFKLAILLQWQSEPFRRLPDSPVTFLMTNIFLPRHQSWGWQSMLKETPVSLLYGWDAPQLLTTRLCSRWNTLPVIYYI